MSEIVRKNNEWRRRIIRLLEELLEDLQKRPPNPAQANMMEDMAIASRTAGHLPHNIPGGEITESLYYMKPIEIPKTPDPTVYKLEECAEDAAFAVYCFLQDATYFRMFIAHTWHDFALGRIGLQTASFCTNYICVKLETMSDELRKTFTYFEETFATRMHTKVDTFFRDHCTYGAAPSYPDKISPSWEDVKFARCARRRLGYYAHTLTFAVVTRLVFEGFHAQAGQFWGNSVDDMCLLKSLWQLHLTEYQTDMGAQIVKADQMFKAASALVKEHFDTEAIFAAQVLWDIQHLLETRGEGLEKILEEISLDMWHFYAKYAADWNNEKQKATNPSRFQRMARQMSFLHEKHDIDRYHDLMQQWELASNRQCTLPSFKLLRHVPLLITQLVSQFRAEYQTSFLDITNDEGYILTAIHLYNAAKSSGCLGTLEWEDMDWVMDHQSLHSIFSGSPPEADSEYAPRFCAAYGLDATKFDRGRESPRLEQVENDIYLKDVRRVRLEPASHFHKAAVEVVGKTTNADRLSQNERYIKFVEQFAGIQIDLFSPHGEPSNIGYLIAVKEAFEGDEESLIFDIFDFHLRCRRLLTKVRDLCLQKAPEDYPTIRFGGEEGVNPTLAELLLDLNDYPRYHERMWPKAVNLLREFIEEEGSECLEMTFTRMAFTTLDSAKDKSESGDSSSDTAMETPPPEVDDSDGDSDDPMPLAPQPGRSDSSDMSQTSSCGPSSTSSNHIPSNTQQSLP